MEKIKLSDELHLELYSDLSYTLPLEPSCDLLSKLDYGLRTELTLSI